MPLFTICNISLFALTFVMVLEVLHHLHMQKHNGGAVGGNLQIKGW